MIPLKWKAFLLQIQIDQLGLYSLHADINVECYKKPNL
jgi:hypothetical protein